MSYLDKNEADRIITTEELVLLGPIVEKNDMAIRCNRGSVYSGGDGFNLSSDDYKTSIQYATALYASICFAQDTIHDDIEKYKLLLMKDCSLGSGETYTYKQGKDIYTTLPKCHGLGAEAQVVMEWSMNDSAIILARNVVLKVLSV